MKKTIIAFAIVSTIISCKNKKEETLKSTTTHAEQMAEMFPKPKVNIKTVGILLYDGYTTLDAMGPYQVLSEMMGVKVFFVGRNKGLIANMNGMKVQCDTSIAEVKQLDILVIPGGFKETYLATKDTALLSWIKAIDVHSKYTTSVCTGAWILAATGLLKNKEATTHWYGKKILADEFGVKVQDKRFVKSGKYWTSAGVTAGMDMSLELVNEITGEKYTKAVMLDMEYDPQPPFVGGSEQKTDKAIVENLRSMYDGGMKAVLHPDKFFSAMQYDNKKDPVCGMLVQKGVADTAHYSGKVYGFCSAGCKEEFKKNPASYLATK
jgi:putative intracellular protease/amidase/YHS domain-containing protein